MVPEGHGRRGARLLEQRLADAGVGRGDPVPPWSTVRSSSRRGRTRGATPAACCTTPGITAPITLGASRRPRHAKEVRFCLDGRRAPLGGRRRVTARTRLSLAPTEGYSRSRSYAGAPNRGLP